MKTQFSNRLSRYCYALLVLIFFITSSSYAATITSNVTGGTWGAGATWVGGNVPIATDVVVIATTGSNSVTLGAAATCAGLTVNSGSILNVPDFALTVNGTTDITGNINFSGATGTKTFAGNITLNAGAVWNETAAAVFTSSGSLTNNATTFTASTGTHTFTGVNQTIGGSTSNSISSLAFSGTGTAYSISGTLNVGTLMTITSPAVITNNGTINISTALSGTGGLTNSSTGILNISGTSGITTLNATAVGNTVNYNGAAQTVHTGNYSNLTLSGSGAKTLSTGTTAIGGNLTLSGTATTTTVAGLTISGNLAVGNATTFTAAGFTLTVNGTTTVGAGASGILAISSATGTKTFTGALTIATGGTFSESAASTLSFGNDVTINGTLTENGAATIGIAGNLTNNNVYTASTGVHTFSGTAKTISGSTLSIGRITINGTYTNTGTLTIGTALAGATGTLVNNGTLNLGGTCSIGTTSGGLSNTGTLTVTGTGSKTTPLANFTNTGTINLGGSGAITGITNNAAGIVNLASSGTIASFNNATSTSILNISASPVPTITTLTATAVGNTVNYTGTTQTLKVTAYHHLNLSGGAKAFGTITSVAGNLTLSSAATATTGAALAIGGNFTLGTGTTFATGNTNSWTLAITGTTSVTGRLTLANTGAKTFTGDVTINSAGVWNETGAESINFGGSLLNNATTFTANTGTHTFTGAAKSIGGSTSNTIPAVTFSGTGASYTNTGTLIVATLLTITTPAVLTNNGTVTATTALSGTGNLTQGNTGVLNVGGTSGITTLDATAAGNTVRFNGGAQTVHTGNYSNLFLSGSGAKTFGAITTIAQRLSIIPSATASLGGFAVGTNNLSLGGIGQSAGTYGFTGSGATNINTTYFSATLGLVTVNAGSNDPGQWLGLTADWNTATNWGSGAIPTGTIDVGIPSGVIQPIVSGNSMCNSLTINTGATLTNNSTLTVGTSLNGAGTLTNSAAGILNIGGTSTITTLTLSAAGNTVNYNGTGAQTVKTGTYSNLTISGSGLKTTTSVTVNGILSMEGTATVSVSPAYGTGVTLKYNTVTARTSGSEWPATFGGTGGIIIANTGAITMNAAKVLNNLIPLTINNGSTLIANNLNLNIGGNFSNSGTFTGGTGTVTFGGSSVQTIGGTSSTIFNNLTINNIAGVLGTSDVTVNGILNLASANPSSAKGCLDMAYTGPSSYSSLTMGTSSTTTGTYDVSGVVKRTSFVTGTSYTFGSQYTTFNFSSGATLPSSQSVRLVLSATHAFKSNAINRYYDVIVSGSPSGFVTMNLHYQDGTELNGLTDANLSVWDYDTGGTEDHGRTNFDTNLNWFGRGGLDLSYLAGVTTFDTRYWTLGTASTSGNTIIWNGASDTDWTKAINWTTTGGTNPPGPTSDVIIPDISTTHSRSPVFPATTTINTINIQANGVLNGGTNTTLTLSGSAAAWLNQGTFNPGTSTIVFTGSAATLADLASSQTNFYNVNINGASAILTLASNTYAGILNSFTLTGGGSLRAGLNENTIEYKGSSAQTVLVPSTGTPGYHNLILSGAGTKSFAAGTLYIRGDFTNNQGAITIPNDVEFNGPYNMAQNINGNSSTSFTNLRINNPDGVVIAHDLTVNNTLTLTQGQITTGSNTLTIGSTAPGAISGGSSGSYINGNLKRGISAGANTYAFPIGTSTAYAPVSLAFTTGTVTGTLTAFTSDGDHGNIGTSTFAANPLVNRYWTFNVNSGLTTANYDATFNWDAADQDVAFDYTTAKCGKYSGSAWTYPTMGTKTATSAQIIGASGFSDFQIGNGPLVNPDTPSVSVTTNPVNVGGSTTLSIASGNLNDAAYWQWYSGSCDGTIVGSGTSIAVSPAVTTTYYAQGEGNGTTGSCGSITIIVTGNWLGTTSTNWSEPTNWSNNTIPDDTKNVVISSFGIPHFPQITATSSCNDLTLESGASLTINSGKILTVTGTLTNSAGTSGLVIKSTSDGSTGTGSLITSTDGVDATVERWMSGSIWHLISPVVTGQSVSDFITTSANGVSNNGNHYALAPYVESDDSWNYYNVSGIRPDYFSTIGTGYEMLRSSSGVVSFLGSLASGNQIVDIAKSGNGWNLIGNPYPCALDVKLFLDDASNTSNLDGAYLGIYVADIANVTTYGYTAINKISNPTLKLSSGEAFFIKSKTGGGSLNFTTSMKSLTSDAFKSVTVDHPQITLSAETPTDRMSTSVHYISGMTNGLDPGYDAGLYNGGVSPFSIYTKLVDDNGINFQIQALPDNNYDNIVIPVGLVAASGVSVTFKAEALNIPTGYKVVLEDRTTETFTRLDDGGVYTVVLNTASQGTGRFFLRTTQIVSAAPKDLSMELKVIALPQQELIQVYGAVSLPATAKVYDITGRLLLTKVLTGINQNDIPLTGAANGVYMLKVESKKTPVTKKILWNRL